jgi:GLPGLI family protein
MKYLLFFIFSTISISIYAQESNKAFLVRYHGNFNSLFERSNNSRKVTATLLMEGDRSLFTMKETEDEVVDPSNISINLSPDSLFTVYKDIESNSLVFDFMDLNQHPLYYADTLYPMEWKIQDEEKSIHGVLCKLATTSFKGRNYNAWFTPTISISNGPWKLGGLPGLILEAYDDEMQWKLTFDSMVQCEPINFTRYDRIISNGINGYGGFTDYLKKMHNRLQHAFSAQAIGDCLTCDTKSVVKLYSWEKIN